MKEGKCDRESEERQREGYAVGGVESAGLGRKKERVNE